MIWDKMTPFQSDNRYIGGFEYMFILSKGQPSKYNLIEDRKNINGGRQIGGTERQFDGTMKPRSPLQKDKQVKIYGKRKSIWEINSEKNNVFGHPAIFPEQLANDHIISWSNEDDIVMDPFMGSGTTAKAALLNRRKFIGFEISKEYCDIANKRIDYYLNQTSIFDFLGNESEASAQ
jgi:site-specific DNA-methyltransferase (adenine-specific)